jgi:hypothetical protein
MNEKYSTTTLYSTFNARALQPSEVAQTFIPPPEFFRLANNSHTFVVGPRGSGKTTLLKMLQQPAIESWAHSMANRLRESIGFTGVFVPTDITFATQLQAVSFDLSVGKQLVNGAYSIHILKAFLSALEYRTGRTEIGAKYKTNRISLSDKQERDFVSELTFALKRNPRTPSFSSLRTNLTSFMSEIKGISEKLRSETSSNQLEYLEGNGILELDITRTTAMAIDALEGVTGTKSERWALLCDELELAPPYIVEDLIRRVRSTDDRFLFKLSLSPYVSGETELNDMLTSVEGGHIKTGLSASIPPAQENEDFDTIKLWFPSKQDGKDFGRELAQSIIQNRGINDQSIDEILGRSVFDRPKTARRRSNAAYAPGSSRNKRMKRLANSDASFQKYLLSKGIDLDKEMQDDDMRAKTFRKINSIVIVREAFRKKDPKKHKNTNGKASDQSIEDHTSSRRGRKNPGVYAGATAFFAICESNPRFLIGMLNQLLGEGTGKENPLRIDASLQAAVYASATARFRAYLRTVPSPKGISSGSRGLLSLMDLIGKYFYNECVAGPFDDDPDGTFVVDANTYSDLASALQIALNAGAIIWVPEKKDATILTSIRGKRFRLSYLLAPYYQLPLHLGRQVSLGKILREGSAGLDKDQPNLFDYMDHRDES